MDTEANARGPYAPDAKIKARPVLYVLVGLLVGAVVGFAAAWALGGNPLSEANEIVYRELTVASVSEDGDSICWAEDPTRRDSRLQCAILALDPHLPTPAEGDEVVVGLVDVRTPDGSEFRQVVHVAPPGAEPTPQRTPEEVLDDENA